MASTSRNPEGNWKGSRHQKGQDKKSTINAVETDSIRCPLCSHNMSLSRINDGTIEFAQADLNEWHVHIIKKGGGYRSGFAIVGGHTLKEMKDDPRFKKILDDLFEQCLNITEILMNDEKD